MITRYLKPISIISTNYSDFINAIASAFVDVGFTEVVTPTSGITNARAVQFGNFEIDIYQSISVCVLEKLTTFGFISVNLTSNSSISITTILFNIPI